MNREFRKAVRQTRTPAKRNGFGGGGLGQLLSGKFSQEGFKETKLTADGEGFWVTSHLLESSSQGR
jgi:hypothetical protein